MKNILITAFLILFFSCTACVKEHNQRPLGDDKLKPTHSAITPVPNPEPSIQEWWMPRQEAVNQRLKKGNVDLLFIGNSIVNGFDNSGKEIWDQYYKSRNAVNMGFGWDRTQHILWRIENSDFSNVSPMLAIILAGTNNIGRNSVVEITDGISAICLSLKKRLPAIKILLLGIFPRYSETSGDREIIKEINIAISGLGKVDDITFMDIGHIFLDKDKKISTEIMADLLHPTAKGYKLFAEAIEPTVRGLMGEK